MRHTAIKILQKNFRLTPNVGIWLQYVACRYRCGGDREVYRFMYFLYFQRPCATYWLLEGSLTHLLYGLYLAKLPQRGGGYLLRLSKQSLHGYVNKRWNRFFGCWIYLKNVGDCTRSQGVRLIPISNSLFSGWIVPSRSDLLLILFFCCKGTVF